MVQSYRRSEAAVLPTSSGCEQPKNLRIPFFWDLTQRRSKERISQRRCFTSQKNGILNCAAVNSSNLVEAKNTYRLYRSHPENGRDKIPAWTGISREGDKEFRRNVGNNLAVKTALRQKMTGSSSATFRYLKASNKIKAHQK
jgi:hypothetical protein